MNVALNWLITLHIFSWFGTILIFAVPQLEKNKHLARKQYRTDDEVISAVKEIQGPEWELLYHMNQMLQHWLKKCVDQRRDYVEK